MRNDPDIYKELLKKNPFGEYSEVELLALAARLIASDPSKNNYLIEPLSYIWGHLKGANRTEFNQRMPSDLFPILWLPKVKKYLHSIKFDSTPRGRGHVYFIPLRLDRFVNVDSRIRRYGVYIGSSFYKPQTRLKNHLKGAYSNRDVRTNSYNYYLESLSHIFEPISKPYAKEIELKCLKYLRDKNFLNLPKKIILGA
jgi:hypothetical protein